MKKPVLKSTIKSLVYGNYNIAKTYRISRLYYYDFLHSLKAKNRQTVIVYQMGKVGSKTVVKSLRSLKSMTVYHVHDLTHNGTDRAENLYKDNFYKLRRIDNHVLWSQYLRKQLDTGLKGKEKWKVVTLVRDPIAKNISSFFQNLGSFIGYEYKTKIEYMKTEDIVKELIQLFLERFDNHEQPLMWFDSELKPVLNIDVYSSEFPKLKGYEIYEGEYADLLLLRLENLNECASDAFKNFLDIDEFALVESNIGNSKGYRNIYRKFLESIVLPDSYIDKMYTSKYVRHFYTQEEIEAFKAKWHRQNHTCENALEKEDIRN